MKQPKHNCLKIYQTFRLFVKHFLQQFYILLFLQQILFAFSCCIFATISFKSSVCLFPYFLCQAFLEYNLIASNPLLWLAFLFFLTYRKVKQMLSRNIHKRLCNLVEDFLLHLSCSNYSPRTIEIYGHDLFKFIKLLQRIDYPITTTKQALHEERLMKTVSMRYQDTPTLSAHTIHNYMCAYRALIRYLVKMNTLPPEFERFRFEMPKLSMSLPKILPESFLRALLTQPIESWQDMRNRCIFELMAFSGLRIGEVVSIRFNNVSLSYRQIRVLGKGNMERIVPISIETAEHIAQYIHQIHQNSKISISNFLFISSNGSQISPTTIRKILQQKAQAIGYQERITPHYLRHFCATYFVRQTKNIRFVQQLLGHRNIISTQVYVHLDNEYLSKTFDEHCLKINT